MKYELHQCIGSRVRRLSRIIDAHFRPHIAQFGITENQLTVLFVLKSVGKIEQGKIGDVITLERSTVSRNIQLLEKQDMVKRSIDYRPHVELTDKGNSIVDKLIPVWEKVMDELTAKLQPSGMELIETFEKRIA